MGNPRECPRCGEREKLEVRSKRLSLMECNSCGRVWSTHTPSTHGFRESDWERADHYRDSNLRLRQ